MIELKIHRVERNRDIGRVRKRKALVFLTYQPSSRWNAN
jgi:hypothetical protein